MHSNSSMSRQRRSEKPNDRIESITSERDQFLPFLHPSSLIEKPTANASESPWQTTGTVDNIVRLCAHIGSFQKIKRVRAKTNLQQGEDRTARAERHAIRNDGNIDAQTVRRRGKRTASFSCQAGAFEWTNGCFCGPNEYDLWILHFFASSSSIIH